MSTVESEPNGNGNVTDDSDNKTASEDQDNNLDLHPAKEEVYYTDDRGRAVCNITDDGLVRKIMVHRNSEASAQNVSEHILGRVWINLKGTTADGTVFVDALFEEKELCLGKADCSRAIDQALVTMKHGEHAIIEVDDIEKYGYSTNNAPAKCPTSNANKAVFPIRFELVVVDSIAKQPQSFEMTFKEQLVFADLLRQRGNLRYEKGRFVTALSMYDRAIQCLEAMKDLDMSMPAELAKETKVQTEEVHSLRIKLYLNCSICHRRQQEHPKCIEFCTKVLEIDDACKKALIRRGLAYYDLADYDLASKDINAFLRLAEDEKQKALGAKYLKQIGIKKRKQMNKQKEIYGGFLDKNNKKNISLYDDKDADKEGQSMVASKCQWLLDILMIAPNAISNAFFECTKYCRKTNIQKKEQ